MALHTLACPRSLFTFSHEFTHLCTLSYGLVLPCTSLHLSRKSSHALTRSEALPHPHPLPHTSSHASSHALARTHTHLHALAHPWMTAHSHMPMYALACHRLHSQILSTLSHILTHPHMPTHTLECPAQALIFLHILARLHRLTCPHMPAHALACPHILSHGLVCT